VAVGAYIVAVFTSTLVATGIIPTKETVAWIVDVPLSLCDILVYIFPVFVVIVIVVLTVWITTT
jgi:hypothetical protein